MVAEGKNFPLCVEPGLSLEAISKGVVGLSCRGVADPCLLRLGDGRVLEVSVESIDVAPYFEVFRLHLDTSTEEQSAIFEPLPWKPERLDVLMRAEFLVREESPPETFGSYVSTQTAAPPNSVPAGASDVALVGIGLMLTGGSGERLIIAASWSPFRIDVLRDPEAITDFIACCEAIPAELYEPGREPNPWVRREERP